MELPHVWEVSETCGLRGQSQHLAKGAWPLISLTAELHLSVRKKMKAMNVFLTLLFTDGKETLFIELIVNIFVAAVT